MENKFLDSIGLSHLLGKLNNTFLKKAKIKAVEPSTIIDCVDGKEFIGEEDTIYYIDGKGINSLSTAIRQKIQGEQSKYIETNYLTLLDNIHNNSLVPGLKYQFEFLSVANNINSDSDEIIIRAIPYIIVATAKSTSVLDPNVTLLPVSGFDYKKYAIDPLELPTLEVKYDIDPQNKYSWVAPLDDLNADDVTIQLGDALLRRARVNHSTYILLHGQKVPAYLWIADNTNEQYYTLEKYPYIPATTVYYESPDGGFSSNPYATPIYKANGVIYDMKSKKIHTPYDFNILPMTNYNLTKLNGINVEPSYINGVQIYNNIHLSVESASNIYIDRDCLNITIDALSANNITIGTNVNNISLYCFGDIGIHDVTVDSSLNVKDFSNTSYNDILDTFQMPIAFSTNHFSSPVRVGKNKDGEIRIYRFVDLVV